MELEDIVLKNKTPYRLNGKKIFLINNKIIQALPPYGQKNLNK